MPKKHRVKRQKYVEYLRTLEKQRDEFLTKRKNHKRIRLPQEDNTIETTRTLKRQKVEEDIKLTNESGEIRKEILSDTEIPNHSEINATGDGKLESTKTPLLRRKTKKKPAVYF